MGVLVTYTWKPEGEVFAVREGRTVIGRETHGGDRAVNITLAADDSMSGVHATIIYRPETRKFSIYDEKAQTGTFVNDECVEVGGLPLPNYAKVRTGATHWIFIAVEGDTPL
jgi:hypothetical protein